MLPLCVYGTDPHCICVCTVYLQVHISGFIYSAAWPKRKCALAHWDTHAHTHVTVSFRKLKPHHLCLHFYFVCLVRVKERVRASNGTLIHENACIIFKLCMCGWLASYDAYVCAGLWTIRNFFRWKHFSTGFIWPFLPRVELYLISCFFRVFSKALKDSRAWPECREGNATASICVQSYLQRRE